jgi:TRAP-type C4-dicarboxylate transport system substrate-binding protein
MMSCPPAPAADPIVLKFSSYLPPTHHLQMSHQWAADQIEKRTNGRVKIRMYHSESLHGAKKGFEALRSGIADITLAYPVYDPTGFYLAFGGELPFKFPSAHVGVRIMEELYPEYIKAEYEKAGVKLAYYSMTNPYFFVATRKPVKTLADLKGMKIRSAGGITADTMKALGAVPVMMPTPEIYESLEKGVIDGCFMSPASAMSYRLYEVGKYLTVLPVATTGVPAAISPRAWKKLTPDLQAIVFQVFREAGMNVADGYEDETAKAFAEWKKKGGTVITLEAKEVQNFRNAVKDVDDKWVANCEKVKKGAQAKQMLQKMETLQLKYDKMPRAKLLEENKKADMKKLM